MAIKVQSQDVTVNDALVSLVLETLDKSPLRGEQTIRQLSYSFDADDPADAQWIARTTPLEALLEQAQSEYQDAVETDDKPAQSAASQTIKSLTVAINAYLDSAFGYFKRDNGKVTILKGSFLDRLFKAVADVNERLDWLAGDVITIPASGIDFEHHTVKIVRKAASMKRTRVLRPTMASAIADLDKTVKAMLPADETENASENQ